METFVSGVKYLLRNGEKVAICFQDGSKMNLEADDKFFVLRHEDGTEAFRLAITDFGRNELKPPAKPVDK